MTGLTTSRRGGEVGCRWGAVSRGKVRHFCSWKSGSDARFPCEIRQNVVIVVPPEPNGVQGSRVQIPPSRFYKWKHCRHLSWWCFFFATGSGEFRASFYATPRSRYLSVTLVTASTDSSSDIYAIM